MTTILLCVIALSQPTLTASVRLSPAESQRLSQLSTDSELESFHDSVCVAHGYAGGAL